MNKFNILSTFSFSTLDSEDKRKVMWTFAELRYDTIEAGNILLNLEPLKVSGYNFNLENKEMDAMKMPKKLFKELIGPIKGTPEFDKYKSNIRLKLILYNQLT